MLPRKPYPTDVSDDEWAFVVPYLTLMTPDAPQREDDLREVFNALRWLARAGAGWRLMPRPEGTRLPSLARGLPAVAAVAEGRLLCGDGPRPARPAAPRRGQSLQPERRHLR